jgi:hypothetical protein
MNNTANGGRKCKQYLKDGVVSHIRFVIVNNRRTMTTYANIWDGETKVGQTMDTQYKNTAETMKRAEKILADKGYDKV